ncbi:MAG: hypothetical protein QOI57_3127 [Rubrobacteraceae bacterium]|nr:hypothetical protein [Rubrobacteraceae bacterium]
MLIYSMSVSVDGFIADREGAFGWGTLAPRGERAPGPGPVRREPCGGPLSAMADERAVPGLDGGA